MAVNTDHYAIVIGLTLYPKLGDEPPSNLLGPVNDANAVHEWLTSPTGGGLPPENVTLITSPDPPPDSRPDTSQIQKAFVDLADLAEKKRTGVSALLGRRLYIYAAGHGFSPKLNQGCLLAAEAGGNIRGANVAITDWLDRFRDAGYFFETVLWMDCCMNRMQSDFASPVPFVVSFSNFTAGPAFTAISARRPLRAVEQKAPDDKIHGVFTTVLLDGLSGAAVNPYGMVTGRSLADWLRNAMFARLSQADRDDQRVSKEPDILKEDQDLVFARGVAPTHYEVKLSVPGAAGMNWKLWSGRPLTTESGTVPASELVNLKRRPGLYCFEVEEAKLRQAFEVAGPIDLAIDQHGEPVGLGTELVEIDVDPKDPLAEIYLVDESFNLVDRDVGRLATAVPPAIYKTKIRSGDRLAQQVYLLDRAPKKEDAVPALPAFATAVPLPGTAFSHEYHVDGLNHAADQVGASAGNGAQILLISRVWREDGAKPLELPPAAALQLWKGNKKIADLHEQGRLSGDPDPIATLLVDVDPGVYFVRGRDESGKATIEQAVVALPNYRTSVFLLLTPDDQNPDNRAPVRSALLMHEIGHPFDAARDLIILQAENAVGKGRAVLTSELETALIDHPDNPLAELIGGHLLILEQQRRPSVKIEQLQPLSERLSKLRGDLSWTDVDALLIAAFGAKSENVRPIAAPPMFKASWDIISEASLVRPDLIPAALYDRMFATAPLLPFVAWSIDAPSRKAFSKRIKDALEASPLVDTNVGKPTAEPAADLGVVPTRPSPRPAIAPASAMSFSVEHGLAASRPPAFDPALPEGQPTLSDTRLANAEPPPPENPEGEEQGPVPDSAAAELRTLGLPASALSLDWQ